MVAPSFAKFHYLLVPIVLKYISWQPDAVSYSTMTLNQLLDIEDVLVTPTNPARADGNLDVARCAKLHNHLVALSWMERHQKSAQELNELTDSHRSYFDVFGDEADEVRQRLDPQFASFLESIHVLPVGEEKSELFLCIQRVAEPSDIQNDEILEVFHAEDDRTDYDDDIPLFALLYTMIANLAPHSLGIVYHQQLRRVAFVPTIWEAESVLEHDDVWVPLESLLSHWINLVRRGKASLGEKRWDSDDVEGVWRFGAFGDYHVAGAVAAFDRLVTSIEQRMSATDLLPVSSDNRLLSDADLDAAGAAEGCFARAFLTQARTPRFANIAPGIAVPHDASAFAARQVFTRLQQGGGDNDDDDRPIVPPILMFASSEDRTTSFESDNRYISKNPFLREFHFAPGSNNHAPAGVYSESIKLGSMEAAADGFRLLLPFGLVGGKDGARMSDGLPLAEGSVADLFQHGSFPLGGVNRAQRLERLFDAWVGLIERGVWQVGPTGVEGSIEVFRDADTAWQDYWIPLDLDI